MLTHSVVVDDALRVSSNSQASISHNVLSFNNTLQKMYGLAPQEAEHSGIYLRNQKLKY